MLHKIKIPEPFLIENRVRVQTVWWSIVHSTRTQHFLTGDRFGIVREVEIEHDPVIKDIDRVDKGINDLPQVFHLPTELAIGVILVGTCPGGTSSNVMTYLSKGDVALSVGMTAVSTVLAPFLTPLLTLLYAGQRVEVNPVNMFLSIVKVVLVPIALGFVVNHFFHAFTQNAVRVLPLISTTAIVLIICAVVSANSAKIMTSGLLILAVVILHNLLGYLTGFGVGKLLKLDSTKCRAISIEVGMQNSGLATSLAAAHFAQYPLATIPGAVFSVWHNISGALLANFFARTAEKKD